MRPKSTEASRRLALKDMITEAASRDFLLWRGEAERAIGRDLDRLKQGKRHCLGGIGNDFFRLVALQTVAAPWTRRSVDDLARAMTYSYVNARSNDAMALPKSDGEDFVADNACTAIDTTIWTALLYARFGQWERARWLATYLLGYFEGGSMRSPSKRHDVEYHELTRQLMQALADDRWPETFDVALGPYRPLLHGRVDAEIVASALVDVMDLRMSRWLGYNQVDDARRRPPSSNGQLMGSLTFAAIPAELWAIRAMAERFDGVALSLEGNHPWLKASFMTPPPAPLPSFDDELLRHFQAPDDGKIAIVQPPDCSAG